MKKERLNICIDMDGVIAKFTDSAFVMAKEVFDLELTIEDMVHSKIGNIIWNKLPISKRLQLSNEREIYKYLCPEGFFESLEIYDGAVKAIKMLSDFGHNITFLTKPLEWRYSSNEKIKWLNKYFGNIDYSVIMVSDMQAKHIIDADLIIDDDPRVLEGIEEKRAICIARKWNEEYRVKQYNGVTVENIYEAAQFIIKNEKYYLQLDKEGLEDAPKSN